MGSVDRMITGRVTTDRENNLDIALAKTIAREELAFCLPLSINIGHCDQAKILLVALHIFTLVILMLSLPVLPGGVLSVAVLISLVFGIYQQRRLADFDAISCDQSGQWRLLAKSNSQNHGPAEEPHWVRLESLVVAGPYCLLRLRRFGSSVYWISEERHQVPHCWRRLRVLSQLL